MKQIIIAIGINFLAFFVGSAVLGQIYAGTLKFDQPTVTANVGDTINIQVIVDAGSDQIASTDIYVVYDPNLLEAQTITAGSFFPTVVNNITLGKLYIAGVVESASGYKTGSGDVATISFKALAAGTTTLTFDCQTGVYNSSKIIKNDIDATNVIDCSQSGTSTITIGGGAATTTTNTTVATITPLPRTGIFENVTKVAVPGAVLLLIGGVLRLIL